ncbi:cytochrome P450 [Actinomadura barringtoniae]|uniref:Cytochrome P450 n=1 Tax=Actinomadura barringtoniae TaxID=1427535 RepID=A0A939PJN5_9ACTN|nr:cytochrome P450 [Actinomadura barringtoniae]MBO2454137.1 cytochrome P450 [Actinomadura barringtoniae]
MAIQARPGGTHDEINISDLRFWLRRLEDRAAAFAVLRGEDGPRFYADPPIPFTGRGKGYWALVRHADVAEASRNPKIFSSEPNATSVIDSPSWLNRYINSMINMDDPRHAKIRRIVSRAFSPKMLSKTEDDVVRRAERIVDELIATGPGDFVAKVAVRLPVEVICDMLGIPDDHYPRVIRLTNIVLGNSDAEFTGITPEMKKLRTGIGLAKVALASRELHKIAAKLGKERIAEPTGDLTSALVNANIEGEKLTAQEFGTFFLLLVVAGNETTRTAIAHGLKLFSDNPAQRDLLLEDFDGRIGGAVEEIVRYSTPVINFRRNLTQDHEMNGHLYRKGDKVLLFYNSANRDESVFEDPDAFDITRDPNPHLGFGGPGPHFCLGANLARREIAVMFRELFTRLPDLRTDGEPDRLASTFINGYKRLPCTFTAP